MLLVNVLKSNAKTICLNPRSMKGRRSKDEGLRNKDFIIHYSLFIIHYSLFIIHLLIHQFANLLIPLP
jgi:hypothetical protein